MSDNATCLSLRAASARLDVREAGACAAARETGPGIHPRILERLLRNLIEADPSNMDLKTAWIALQRVLAFAEADSGHLKKSRDRLIGASRAVDEMLIFDPGNEAWARQSARLDADIAAILPAAKERTMR